ncbi:MAG: DUF378 domain-containing protein [Chloroflexota bacterium]|jgi:uncharacterized membrane protein YuzA (DUF378 family)|nr:DUF378 domain-containing protein [Chloroflexota bacterium]|tara:strand:+ start:4538 stop:4741 length:204 start_codon:yes stop_codon:yes gene_type:complete
MDAVILVATILAIVGAVNWGLAGLFGLDLVAAVTGSKFGETNTISKVIYGLVGLSGLVVLGELAGLI